MDLEQAKQAKLVQVPGWVSFIANGVSINYGDFYAFLVEYFEDDSTAVDYPYSSASGDNGYIHFDTNAEALEFAKKVNSFFGKYWAWIYKTKADILSCQTEEELDNISITPPSFA